MNILHKFFFTFSPILFLRIDGNSMIPYLKSGDEIIAVKIWLGRIKKGDVVILKHPYQKRYIVKRIQEIKNKKFFVIGDNIHESTDSRQFGLVEKKHIVGKVVYTI